MPLPIEEVPIQVNDVLDTQPVGSLPTSDNDVGNAMSRIADRLLGTNGKERYTTWPERLVRDAISAPHDIMQQNPYPEGSEENLEFERSRQGAIPQASLNMAALAGTGGLVGADASLGAGPFLRPALKYEGKIYKAPMGGEHMDAIPKELQGEFTRQALSGEDISNFNFGFLNHKGHFLDREDALKYAIDNGLLSPHDAKYGALTSTMNLNADASKEAAAIDAMKYPLAKPSDRWINTLGQNDSLIKDMTPDEFLNKSRPLKVDAESRENIDILKEHIKDGGTLDPLELHSNGKEDGRHRAMAAKELGIKKVPVIDFRDN
jgi:hypothetical protein